ncbi:MAG: PKD domain-containing protein, partial [Dehalococcoidia bacterium]
MTLTVTPTLNTGVFGEAFEVSVALTGTNVDTATVAGTGTVAPQYAGSAGEDSIIATMLWGGAPASTSLASAPATVTWSVAPVADAGGPYAASEGDSVAFDGSASTGDAERTYAWDFGDGGTSTEVEPEHTYVHDATYEVTLTVTNPDESTDVATVDAIIANVAPSVDAGANTSVALGAAVEVSATFSDAGALDAPWAWVIDWGDGSADATGTTDEAGAAIVRSHTYGAAGQRSVTVCVTDKDAGEGCDTRTVQVTAPPEPPPEEIETPVATPTATPSVTPTPTPTSTPVASPTPAATPASTPTATPTAAATPSPTPPPASTPAATPAPTSTATPPPLLPLPASTPPPGAGSGATPAPPPVTPTA